MACTIKEQKEAWMIIRKRLQSLATIIGALDFKQHFDPQDPELLIVKDFLI